MFKEPLLTKWKTQPFRNIVSIVITNALPINKRGLSRYSRFSVFLIILSKIEQLQMAEFSRAPAGSVNMECLVLLIGSV